MAATGATVTNVARQGQLWKAPRVAQGWGIVIQAVNPPCYSIFPWGFLGGKSQLASWCHEIRLPGYWADNRPHTHEANKDIGTQSANHLETHVHMYAVSFAIIDNH